MLCPSQCRFRTLPHYTAPSATPAQDDERQAEADDSSHASNEARKGDADGTTPRSASSVVPWYDPATTVVLYPSPTAVCLSDPSLVDVLPRLTTVVVIESTWQKGGAVYAAPELGLQRLRAVRLSEYESTYWRYQELGRHALCTLEAMYHTCRELLQLEAERGGEQRREAMRGTQLDDLLYFYAAQHSRLQSRYAQPHTQPAAGGEEGEEQEGAVEAGSGDEAAECAVGALSAAAAASSVGQQERSVAPASERLTKTKPPPRAWKPT